MSWRLCSPQNIMRARSLRLALGMRCSFNFRSQPTFIVAATESVLSSASASRTRWTNSIWRVYPFGAFVFPSNACTSTGVMQMTCSLRSLAASSTKTSPRSATTEKRWRALRQHFSIISCQKVVEFLPNQRRMSFHSTPFAISRKVICSFGDAKSIFVSLFCSEMRVFCHRCSRQHYLRLMRRNPFIVHGNYRRYYRRR